MAPEEEVLVVKKGRRFYRYKGHEYISVTTMLNLIKDQSWKRFARYNYDKYNPLAREPYNLTFEEYSADAMLMGKYMHWRCGAELARRAGLPRPKFDPDRPLPEYREDDFEVMTTFWEDFKWCTGPVAFNAGVEKFLRSDLGYGGRVDMVLDFNYDQWLDRIGSFRKNFRLVDGIKRGERWLVDLKTGARVYEGTEAQVTAYFMAWNAAYPDHQVQRMAILHINGDGWRFIETAGDPAGVAEALAAAVAKGLIRPTG